MDDNLRSNLSHIRYYSTLQNELLDSSFMVLLLIRCIGEKLYRIEKKIPEFKQHLEDLETDYRRVSTYFDDILASHEKTFLSVRRNIEQSDQKLLGELEMKMLHPIKYSKYKHSDNSEIHQQTAASSHYNNHTQYNHYIRERSEMNPELPSFVSAKYP